MSCIFSPCSAAFQSTLPRGERPVGIVDNTKVINFNPRSREGSDDFLGVTLKFVSDFNPRSREGSDWRPSVRQMELRDFNPRSREGSD